MIHGLNPEILNHNPCFKTMLICYGVPELSAAEEWLCYLSVGKNKQTPKSENKELVFSERRLKSII